MAEYLLLAENVMIKNDKLTCINVYNKLSTIAMPSEFKFDLALICGPDWKPGEHKIKIKAKGNNDKEVDIGELTVNIPDKDFVYNAYANDIKVLMDYSVSNMTILVYDGKKEILSRKYPVIPMLVPQKEEKSEEKEKVEA